MTRIAAGLLFALVTIALVHLAHEALKKREFGEAVVALVAETSAELREALSLEAASSLAGTPEAVSRLERYARWTGDRLAMLESFETWRDPELADAARSYMEAARRLLETQVASHRQRGWFAWSTETLREHMETAHLRTEGWIEEALRRKRQVDRSFAEYRLAVENYGRLLDAYPTAREDLAARIGGALLVDDALASEARERVIEAGRRAAAEMERVRRLAAPR